MVLCPPLIITREQVDELCEKIGLSLDRALAELKGH